MNLKKIAASFTAAVCCTGILSYLPQISEKTFAEDCVYNDFEVNYDGWHSNTDTVKLKAENGKGFENSRGMTVSGRKTKSDGVSSSKGFYLTGEINYTYSIKVYSKTDEKFRLSLLCIDCETGKETVIELKNKNVKAGKWTELSADYTAPENSCEFRLTLTTDSVNDFSFDDVLITSKEKNSSTVFAASADKGLKDEFAGYFKVGNILNGSTVQNSAITANILKDYNSIECENEMKPDATIVQSQCTDTNIGVSLNNAAAIMDFCVQNNIAMRGHTLVWHSQTPTWFFKDNFQNDGNWVSSDVMDQRMESYIKNIFAAIKEQYPELDLYAYDVANECISDDSERTQNNGGTREPGENISGQSPWVQVYGDNSFVEKAFTYARKYAPDGCALYYNDYNEYWDHKRDAIYSMCKSLYEKGLLDGVGMQSHINANYDGFSGVSAYTTAMKKFLSIGCDVQITELDISTENGTYTLQQQADKYKAIFQAAMDWNSNPESDGRVTAVCIWGPNDANTWIKTENAPLLYDADNQPKLAYTTLISMIPESEWGSGSTPVEPNEYGWYFQDGFEGDVCSWTGRGSADIMTSGRTYYVGNEALLVQNREASWNGAAKPLSTAIFKPGTEYSFSANVTYFDGNSTDKFYLKLQYTDENGETQYSTIAEATGIKGEWVQLANKNYKIPADASNMQLYIETAETTNNFYIDEVIGAVGGTSILGAGSVDIIAGDVNCDGTINVLDVILAKRGISSGFDNTAQEIAADVDQSGTADTSDVEYIQQFLTKKITEFPIAEKPVTPVDTEKMASIFSGITIAESYKKDNVNNPLFTQRFGADPGVMEYNGRIYVYTTNDVIEYDDSGNVVENTYAQINKINCISSDDMVNWTDHGSIEVAGENGIAKWTSNSWAPCAAHKTINGKEKFFLYFCNGGNGVSVLTADSPTGPWTDPLGKGLITRSTPNCSDVTWLFDPAVLVDDDGTGYLYFGGGVPEGKTADPGTARVVQLGDDMISIVGTPQTINPPYLFEDSGINKIGDKYYYTYCSNWNTSGNSYGMTSGAIEYMVSDSPMGPFTYGGELFKNQGNFFGLYGNNHHSIAELNGQLYLFYHARPVEAAMGIDGNYRSPQADKITMDGENFTSVTGTMTGIPQLQTLNPYAKVQAETMSDQAGINVKNTGDTIVTDIDKGDWIKVSGVNFSNGASTVTLKVSSKNGCAIKICTGSPSGKAIGYAEVPEGGSMDEITFSVDSISGTQDLYFVFSSDAEFDYWYFS
ncbi:endo-1,4-beta-xylanase [Porcipelethomonas sp.]|uniref:endo-1,4-beta-xylanase n=1 Tax=Porcipelethomonas sp. TaxID=2981675 RepID=UPI003EF3F1F8